MSSGAFPLAEAEGDAGGGADVVAAAVSAAVAAEAVNGVGPATLVVATSAAAREAAASTAASACARARAVDASDVVAAGEPDAGASGALLPALNGATANPPGSLGTGSTKGERRFHQMPSNAMAANRAVPSTSALVSQPDSSPRSRRCFFCAGAPASGAPSGSITPIAPMAPPTPDTAAAVGPSSRKPGSASASNAPHFSQCKACVALFVPQVGHCTATSPRWQCFSL